MRPRPIIPGKIYLITRRCSQRQFLLRPSKLLNEIFAYCLAWAAGKTNLKIHAIVVMSNHWHAIVSDTDGNLPAFCQILHHLTAKALNCHWGRWENLWDNRQTSYVALPTNEDVIAKMLYVLHNPVSANLVDKGHHWPGLRLFPGDKMKVLKPNLYFQPHGPMPAELTLELSAPNGMKTQSLRDNLKSALKNAEAQSRQQRLQTGQSILGKRRILRQHHTDSPNSSEERRALSPRVSAVDKWARVEALTRLNHFVDAYKVALALWQAGKRDAVFPSGTYAMRKLHNVSCA